MPGKTTGHRNEEDKNVRITNTKGEKKTVNIERDAPPAIAKPPAAPATPAAPAAPKAVDPTSLAGVTKTGVDIASGAAGSLSAAALNSLNQANEMYGNQMGARQQQMDLVKALQAQMAGTGGPSLAELQLRQGLGQAGNMAASQAASMRGVNPALAARMGAIQQTALAGQANEQAAILRARESQAAREQLGNVLAGVRGMDASLYGTGLGAGMQGHAAAGQIGSGLAASALGAQSAQDIAKANNANAIQIANISGKTARDVATINKPEEDDGLFGLGVLGL